MYLPHSMRFLNLRSQVDPTPWTTNTRWSILLASPVTETQTQINWQMLNYPEGSWCDLKIMHNCSEDYSYAYFSELTSPNPGFLLSGAFMSLTVSLSALPALPALCCSVITWQWSTQWWMLLKQLQRYRKFHRVTAMILRGKLQVFFVWATKHKQSISVAAGKIVNEFTITVKITRNYSCLSLKMYLYYLYEITFHHWCPKNVYHMTGGQPHSSWGILLY